MGVPVGQLERSLGMTAQQPVDSLLERVHDVVNRICVPLMPPESPVYRSPGLFLLPVMRLMTQYSGWGNREMNPFGRVLSIWGSPVLTRTLFLSPIAGKGKFLLALSCATLGER